MKLFLVDFGLADKFLDKDKKHLPDKIQNNNLGNFVFASKWAFLDHRHSRRDDVCMVFYNLIWMLEPNNSWLGEKGKMSNINQALEETKENKLKLDPKEVCSPKRTQFLIKFCEEIYSYGYDEQPNYNKLIFLLEKELIEEHCLPDQVFSFL